MDVLQFFIETSAGVHQGPSEAPHAVASHVKDADGRGASLAAHSPSAVASQPKVTVITDRHDRDRILYIKPGLPLTPHGTSYLGPRRPAEAVPGPDPTPAQTSSPIPQ